MKNILNETFGYFNPYTHLKQGHKIKRYNIFITSRSYIKDPKPYTHVTRQIKLTYTSLLF